MPDVAEAADVSDVSDVCDVCDVSDIHELRDSGPGLWTASRTIELLEALDFYDFD